MRRSRILTWHISTFWPTKCTHRILMPAASSRTSTSSPVKRARRSNYPETWWGCPGGKGDKMYTVTHVRGYGPRIPACFNNKTLGDELDKAGAAMGVLLIPGAWGRHAVRRRHGLQILHRENNGIRSDYHEEQWHLERVPGHQAHLLRRTTGSKTSSRRQTQFFTDVKDGELRTLVGSRRPVQTPTTRDATRIPGRLGSHRVVNAIGESKYWKSTAIFIFWDDYGGWYDPEPPAYVDYDGLGGGSRC